MVVKKDWVLVSYLRRNCRMRLTDISKRTHTPISTLYDRLRDFEASGLLRHSALLDFAKLGFVTRAVVLFNSHRSRHEKLAVALRGHPNVNCLFKVNNGQFLAECVFRSLTELESFTDRLDAEFDARHQTYFVIDDIKREGFLSDPELVPLALPSVPPTL